MFRFTIRDVLWFTVVIALTAALLIEYRKRVKATLDARDRALEAEYWLHQTLKVEEEVYGTIDNPKGKFATPTTATPLD